MENNTVKTSFKYSMQPTQGEWQHFVQCDEVGTVSTINVGTKRIATLSKHDECCVDAQLIVKAVNNFENLLQMCKYTLEDLQSGEINNPDTQQMAIENLIAAIQKAEQ